MNCYKQLVWCGAMLMWLSLPIAHPGKKVSKYTWTLNVYTTQFSTNHSLGISIRAHNICQVPQNVPSGWTKYPHATAAQHDLAKRMRWVWSLEQRNCHELSIRKERQWDAFWQSLALAKWEKRILTASIRSSFFVDFPNCEDEKQKTES